MSMAIRGLASGLDIDDIIDKLVMAERMPIVKMANQQQQYQARVDAWRDVNSRLYNLRQVSDSLMNLKTFQPIAVTSSKSDVATATVGSNADPATYDLNVLALATKHRIAGAQIEGDGSEELGLAGSLNINGVEIEVAETDSLIDIKDKLNDSKAGIKASIVDKRLVLESQETGLAHAFNIENDANGLAQELGFLDEEGDILLEVQAAGDAKFTVNGLEINTSTNNVKDVVEGVTFNLVNTGKTRLEVKEDWQGVVQKFEELVAQFNSTYQFINDKLGKEGTLQGDTALARIKDQIRNAFMDTIGLDANDGMDQAAVLGFKIDWKTSVLSFDKEKFTEILKEDPDKVQALWQGTKEDNGFVGISNRLDGVLADAMKDKDGTVSLRQGYYKDLIEGLGKNIEKVEARAEMVKDRLIQQWTALEKALQEMSTQGSWLAQQTQMLSTPSQGNR